MRRQVDSLINVAHALAQAFRFSHAVFGRIELEIERVDRIGVFAHFEYEQRVRVWLGLVDDSDVEGFLLLAFRAAALDKEVRMLHPELLIGDKLVGHKRLRAVKFRKGEQIAVSLDPAWLAQLFVIGSAAEVEEDGARLGIGLISRISYLESQVDRTQARVDLIRVGVAFLERACDGDLIVEIVQYQLVLNVLRAVSLPEANNKNFVCLVWSSE